MGIIDPSRLITWKTAKKTKPIKAKPLSQIVSDVCVFNKFLLQTIEGVQPLRPASIVCLGIEGEAWPQTKEALLKKYTITDIDPESGWLTCTPKPENSVNALQITNSEYLSVADEFSITALWGEKQPNGTFVQHGKGGDYVVQSTSDLKDVWIVARNVFESTYEVSNE